MQPIVNGLNETFGDQIEFRELNANAPDGQQAFSAYALPGHPGYVLLNPEGEILWRGFGEQTRESIETQLQSAMNR